MTYFLQEDVIMLDNETPMAPEHIHFTDIAVSLVNSLIEEEGNNQLKLRVFVQGGGCAGFQYGFQFDETVNDDDAVMEKDGVTFLIDSLSYQYLVGAEIDFKEDLTGAQFVIRNPNAVTTCGCGSSFSVYRLKPDKGPRESWGLELG